MSKPIRIGTRDSELALWQAKTVQHQLEYLGHNTELVPLKSTGDLSQDQPIYQMGISGVFTKVLDIALLNKEIDIAVHSLKDVPTELPEGLTQVAVLKRGNFRDTLVYKNNEEFLSQEHAVIATGSLRRKAQWLNRHPTHTVVGLRGNVNTRLQKLKENDWNGAIFAAAGLARLGLRPQGAINLEWMLPAPGQGAIMIAARENDSHIRQICQEINDEETEICTDIERDFLFYLEGGCSAPIGALAQIKDGQVHFQGVLLSLDGSKKIEVNRTEILGNHQKIAEFCSLQILERGGRRLLVDIRDVDRKTQVFSTKKLTELQRLRFQNVKAESSDFLRISLNRIPKPLLKQKHDNVIITSQNAVEAIAAIMPKEQLQFGNIYCVGRRTKKLVEAKIGKVRHSENNAEALAEYLVEYMEGSEATYFCGESRLDQLPEILEKNQIKLHEIVSYQTVLDSDKIDEGIEGILFFSPSTVESYLLKNKADKVAYCIGETTAEVARKHFEDVRVAKTPTVEGVIDLVNENYK